MAKPRRPKNGGYSEPPPVMPRPSEDAGGGWVGTFFAGGGKSGVKVRTYEDYVPQTQQPDIPSDSEIWDYKANMRRAKGMVGGIGAGMPGTTTFTPATPGAEWWKPLAYQGTGEAELLANTTNALIPSLSSAEQVNVAKWLGQNFDDFKSYETASAIPMSTDMAAMRRQFFSKERAQSALRDLDTMRNAIGATEAQMGSGYSFLRKTLSLLDKYAGEGGISRANFAAMNKEFEGISSGVDANYVELGKTLLNPTNDGNPLMGSIRANGRDSFGIPNTKLFT